VLAACFEHALGKDTARGCAKALMGGVATVDLTRALLRFAPDPTVAAERIRALYTPTSSQTSVETAVREPLNLDLDASGRRW
jgi:hypothetical protein